MLFSTCDSAIRDTIQYCLGDPLISYSMSLNEVSNYDKKEEALYFESDAFLVDLFSN